MRRIVRYITCILFSVFISLNIYAQEENTPYTRAVRDVNYIMRPFSDNNLGAVVGIIQNGDLVLNKAYGLANYETKEIMSESRVFNLAGISKSFTAMAVLKLVEKNKIQLDNTLTDIFPEFPEYGRKVKIRYLLNHTSGLPNYDDPKISNNSQVLEYLLSQDSLEFEPNSKWQYSNSDYALLVKIIEKTSKKTYKKYLTKTILKKLKMENTYFAEDAIIENQVFGHFIKDEIYHPQDMRNLIYGEQGIYSCTEDLAKWEKALYNESIISKASLKKMFSIEKMQFGDRRSYYGYGWVIMERNGIKYFWHEGGANGYSNFIITFPDVKMTVIVLTNRFDVYDFLRNAINIAKEFDETLMKTLK